MRHRRALAFHLLFILSGAAGLIYQVVWTRSLVLVFGATVQSASVVLAAFMAGFGLGGFFGGIWSLKPGGHLRAYGLLEAAVALLALLFPWTLLAAKPLLAAAAGSPGLLLLVKSAVVFLLLLPSTSAMGATFPVLLQGLGGADPDRGVGSLFAANTLGACLGVLASGFLLIGWLGLSATTYAAVAANLAAGGMALWLSRDPSDAQTPDPETPDAQTPSTVSFALYFATGLCGMASEVVWYRLLLPSFNNSVYGFSTVLATYLAGLSLGGWLSRRLSGTGEALGSALGWVLAACGMYSLGALYIFEMSQLLQMRYADLYAMGVRPLLAWPLAEAAAVLLPVAVLQGMVLPMLVRLAAPHAARVGHLVGRLYAANTTGAILGALCAGFWWIPLLSVQKALLVIVVIYATLGLAVMLFSGPQPRLRLAPVLAVAALLLVARAWAGRSVPARVLLDWLESHNADVEILHYAEDAEASVAVVRRGPHPTLVINGVGVAGYSNATKTLAHLPLALHPKPERALVICFGMGTTFRSALSHPGIRVDVIDLVPSVLESFPFFYRDAAARAAEPRARILSGDGRGLLALSRQRYDVILADPSPPLYAAGTVNLYNRDFFALAGSRLNDGGLLAVWLPEYPAGEFEMVMKSFFAALPYAQAWKGSRSVGGLILLGSRQPIRPDQAAFARRLSQPSVHKDYLEFDREFADPGALRPLFLGDAARFDTLLRDTPVVTDDHPWIEYPYFRSKHPQYFRPPQVLRWKPAKL